VNEATFLLVLCFAFMQSVKENLIAALRHIMRPLCRIAVRNGIRLGDLSSALNDALVRAADAEFKAAGIEDASDEEVAQKTGMTPAQVRGAKRNIGDETGVKNFSFAAQEVLAGWHSDHNYSGPYGLVLDIPFSSDIAGHGNRSFEALVRKYAGPEISARVVLEELLKTKNVENVGDGILRSSTRTYIAERLSPENIQRFATVVHNLIGTTAVNLQREVPGTGLMERTVWADFGLNAGDMQKFNAFIRNRGQSFADEVDTWLQEHSNAERRGSIRTGIGLYHYVENDDDREAYLRSVGGKGDDNG
jgi:hypothetical protein